MKRYIQTFFRHRVLLIAPIVIALVVSLGYARKQPKKYVTQATLWADSPLPADSSIIGGSGTAPATSQSAVLSELLHTHNFMVKVGQRVGVPADNSDSLGKGISVATAGPQVITLTAKGPVPKTAADVAKAVADQFMAEVVSSRQQRGQALEDYYKQRFDAASRGLNDAKSQLGDYLRIHPVLPGATSTDPTPTQLASNVAQAQDQFNKAQDNVTKAGLDLSHISDSSQLHIVDEPMVPWKPLSSKKKVIFAGVGGLLAGSLVSLLTLTMFVAMDTSVRREADIEDALGLQVVGTIKQFPSRRRDRKRVS